NAVWRDADPNHFITSAEQLFEIFQISFRRVFDKTDLKQVCFGLITSPRVGNAQQRDANADISRSANHFSGEKIWIRVSRAIRRAMNVVKLANGRNSGQRHLEKSQPRSRINFFWP